MSDYKLIDITRLTKFKEKLLGILTYSSPTTSTSSTSIEFIDAVSQSNGKISASKKKVSTFAGGNTAGLVPAAGTGDAGKFLGSDGKWSKPTGTTYSNYTYSSTTKAGAAGLVPAPGTNASGKFLKGDSGWSDLPTASTTQKGIVQLNNTLSSYSTTEALTAAQGLKLARAFDNFISEADFTSPTASGTATSFIDTVYQFSGKIGATKKAIPEADRNTKGILAFPSLPTGQLTSTTRFLREDGEWTVPPPSLATTESIGAVPKLPDSATMSQTCYTLYYDKFGGISWEPSVGEYNIPFTGVNPSETYIYYNDIDNYIRIPASTTGAVSEVVDKNTYSCKRFEFTLPLEIYLRTIGNMSINNKYIMLSFTPRIVTSIKERIKHSPQTHNLKGLVYPVLQDLKPTKHSGACYLSATFAQPMTFAEAPMSLIITNMHWEGLTNATEGTYYEHYALKIIIE